MDSKRIPLLDIDVQGAIKFKNSFPDSNFMAIVPPSVTALK
jgi:guanylate kinase